METKDILKRLCCDFGVSGRENEMFETVRELLGDNVSDIKQLPTGTVVATAGDPDSEYHIMLDAHIDRIGLVVTYIDDEGFIKAEPVGGIDLRELPTSAVTVKGKQELTGIVCALPPHLTKEEKDMTRDKIWIDTGLSAEEVKKYVSQGDTVILKSRYREMLGNTAAAAALDNRSGCAALIKTAELLKDKEIRSKVSLVFSSQEETNESGAKTAAFELSPDESVVVDVGFARQEGVPKDKSGEFGGVIISIAPVLSKAVTDRLIGAAEKNDIKYYFEVDGSNTGTNADGIAITKGGIPCGVLSVPEKNMHTRTEMVCIDDIDRTAQVLVTYITERGNGNA